MTFSAHEVRLLATLGHEALRLYRISRGNFQVVPWAWESDAEQKRLEDKVRELFSGVSQLAHNVTTEDHLFGVVVTELARAMSHE